MFVFCVVSFQITIPKLTLSNFLIKQICRGHRVAQLTNSFTFTLMLRFIILEYHLIQSTNVSNDPIMQLIAETQLINRKSRWQMINAINNKLMQLNKCLMLLNSREIQWMSRSIPKSMVQWVPIYILPSSETCRELAICVKIGFSITSTQTHQFLIAQLEFSILVFWGSDHLGSGQQWSGGHGWWAINLRNRSILRQINNSIIRLMKNYYAN